MTALSKYASIRAKQRGICEQLAQFVAENADLEWPVGDGCVPLAISRSAAQGLPAARDVSRLALIWNITKNQIVTVMHLKAGMSPRKYAERF